MKTNLHMCMLKCQKRLKLERLIRCCYHLGTLALQASHQLLLAPVMPAVYKILGLKTSLLSDLEVLQNLDSPRSQLSLQVITPQNPSYLVDAAVSGSLV